MTRREAIKLAVAGLVGTVAAPMACCPVQPPKGRRFVVEPFDDFDQRAREQMGLVPENASRPVEASWYEFLNRHERVSLAATFGVVVAGLQPGDTLYIPPGEYSAQWWMRLRKAGPDDGGRRIECVVDCLGRSLAW